MFIYILINWICLERFRIIKTARVPGLSDLQYRAATTRGGMLPGNVTISAGFETKNCSRHFGGCAPRSAVNDVCIRTGQ